jgi:1,4-alpha-glucan branching enzyme
MKNIKFLAFFILLFPVLIFAQVTTEPATPKDSLRPAETVDGINYINDSTVTFLLFAPDKQHVHLIGDFNDWKKDNNYQLYKDGNYRWFTVSGLKKGEEYAFQYLIDNQFKIADPYANKILDPVNDRYIPPAVYPDLKQYPAETEGMVSVFQTGKAAPDRHPYDFTPVPGEQLLIYELLIRDFTEAGTIKAAAEKLDYLKAMGVNAIELMPIQEFDGNDSWGYNPCFYFAPDKAYGTEADYHSFIEQAHQLGMTVILDVVLNHATENNPLVQLYRNAANNRPAADNPWFNEEAPHPYSVFCDFNHEYAGTRDFFKRFFNYWLTEYDVDGFRLDLSKGLTQNHSTEATASLYDASRVAIIKDYNAYIKSIKPDAHTILEHFCENREEKELAEAGMLLWNNMNNAYCQTAMGYRENSSLTGGSANARGWDKNRLITYAESHDEERTEYKAKTWGIPSIKDNEETRIKQAILNAAFLLCTPGPKMIWQFGELGYDHSIDENGRTGKKPVLWNYYDDMKRRDLYLYYSLLLDLRNKEPELFSAPEQEIMKTAEKDWATGRSIVLRKGNKAIVLAGNFTDNDIQVNLNFPLAGHWRDYFSTADCLIPISTNHQMYSAFIPAHSFNLYYKSPENSDSNIIITSKEYTVTLKGDILRIDSDSDIRQISIYSFGGKRLKTKDGTNLSALDVSDIPAGIYLATARTSKGKVFSGKIVICP